MNTYRDNGAIGALIDEYEKAILELIGAIKPLSEGALDLIIDPHTEDKDCVSIASILTHVIRAGQNYIIVIRKHLGEQLPYSTSADLKSKSEFTEKILSLITVSEQLFVDYPEINESSFIKNKIEVSWGNKYDLEQLFEHAIVHILRHRRQIERFIIKINMKP